MKVIVTQDVVTDLDIMNGARGTIIDICLHPDEPFICDLQPTIELKYLPLCVLVKLDHTCTSQLTGLEEPHNVALLYCTTVRTTKADNWP